jgi:hypothetical protein
LEGHASHLSAPELCVTSCTVEVDLDPQRQSIVVQEELQRHRVGIERRIELLLPPVRRQALPEVPLAVEESHSDERDPQVAGGLEVVAGQDPEAPRIDRQGLAHAELGREVSDRLDLLVAPPAPALVPTRLLHVAAEVLLDRGEEAHEWAVLGQLAEALLRHHAEQAHGVVSRRLPGGRVDPAEELDTLVVPGPAKVHGQAAKYRQTFGQRGPYGEASERFHRHELT